MKLHVLLVSALMLSSGLAWAQVTAKETPELKALKLRYQADVTAAMKPIQSRYITQLESQLRSFTQRGDLPAALAIQQELDALKPKQEEPALPNTQKAVIGGTWTWTSTDPGDQSTIQFSGDGTGSHGGRGNIKWEAANNREITVTHPSKGQASLRLSANSQSFSGTGYNGKPVSGHRMK